MTGGFLVLGGGGFVGRELVNHFGCPGTNTTGNEGFIRCDATVAEELKSTIRRLRPRIVINCVGLADVDRAETEPDLAYALNEIVVKNIVSLAHEFRFGLVQISTDYVFDGSRSNYTENDATNPINTYGLTKLAGEIAAASESGTLIVRISTPFGKDRGRGKRQFFRFVIDMLREGREVKAVEDQFVTSTYLPDLAKAIDTLCERNCSGIYHVTGQDRMSRYEFARLVARAAGLDDGHITEASIKDMHWRANRPPDTSLSVSKSLSQGVTYTNTRNAIEEILTSQPGENAVRHTS